MFNSKLIFGISLWLSDLDAPCPGKCFITPAILFDFKKSKVYQEYQAEIAEINRHKWLESEKAGKDIGWNKALVSWVQNHKKDWMLNRKNR